MIRGQVHDGGTPVIPLVLAGRSCEAIVETGFNRDLELPMELKPALNPMFIGHGWSTLAGGEEVWEAWYAVELEFDGMPTYAEAVFVQGVEILVGTGLLENHKLTVDFPARILLLERITTFQEGNATP